MNSMQLKDKLRNISKEKNTDFNTLLRLYMYDRFIERLGASQYKDNFISDANKKNARRFRRIDNDNNISDRRVSRT